MDPFSPRFVSTKMVLLKKMIEQIDDELSDLKKEISRLESICYLPDCRLNWRLRRANIVRKVRELIDDGYSIDNAKVLAAEALNEEEYYVNDCFDSEKAYTVDLNRYAKKYMARQLLKKGFKNVEVAKILGWTPEYVSMLKTGKKPF